MDSRRAPIHLSLVLPALIAGVERRIAMIEATLASAFLLGFGLNTLTVATAVIIAFGVHPLLARVSKADPQALAVYARSLQHQPFYPRSVHPAAPSHLHQPYFP